MRDTGFKSNLKKLQVIFKDSVIELQKTIRDVFRGGRTLDQPRFGFPKWAKWGGILLIGLTIVFGVEVLSRYWRGIPPAQPIPFSHRFHVETKQLNCIFCHPGAMRSSNAGIPPVDKCLLCHKEIASHFWPIQRLLIYKEQNRPIEWVWVNRVPEFVRFSHRAHLAQAIDCGRCHGDVAGMDRVQEVHPFDMNFCVNCHKSYNASVSCDRCHY